MNRNEIIQALHICRNCEDTGNDVRLEEALRAAGSDPALKAILETERAFDAAFARKLEEDVPVPADLRDRLLGIEAATVASSSASSVGSDGPSMETGDNVIRPHRSWWRQPLNLTALGGIAAIFILGFILAPNAPEAPSMDSGRPMASQLVQHSAELQDLPFYSRNIDQVRSYLVQQGSPMAAAFPAGLSQMETLGCMPMQLEDGTRISLICFKGEEIFHYYIAPEDCFKGDAITEGETQFRTFGGRPMAVWKKDGQVHLLTAEVEENRLRELL